MLHKYANAASQSLHENHRGHCAEYALDVQTQSNKLTLATTAEHGHALAMMKARTARWTRCSALPYCLLGGRL